MSTDDDDISRLYQQSKDQQPPAHIDNAILSAAKDAVSGQAQSHAQDNTGEKSLRKGPFSGGWPATVSIAAVLVIAIILVPTIQQEEPTQTTSKKLNNPQLMEQDSFDKESIDRLNSLKEKQRTISIQNKSGGETRHSLQAPEKATSKALTVQDTSTTNAMESTAYERKRVPAVERYTYEERDTAARRRALNLNTLMTIQKSEPAAAPALSSGNTQDKIIVEEIMADDNLSGNLSPQVWLEKIRELIKQGEIKSAKKELDAFKAEYPDEDIEQSILDSFNLVSD